MKALVMAMILAPLGLLSAAGVQAGTKAEGGGIERPTEQQLRAVSPALVEYRKEILADELWSRPGLSPRDRSIVTLAAMIGRNHQVGLRHEIERALDNGVEASEISEVITHLAFYVGWSEAMSAVKPAGAVFEDRGIDVDELPPAGGDRLPLDEEAEAKREAGVEQTYGDVAPGVLEYTTDILFRDLWLRPALTPRDRSLVTISALVASGQAAQLTYHLRVAMDNGITKSEASEMFTQLAFHAGWPKVFSALPVAKEIFEERSE